MSSMDDDFDALRPDTARGQATVSLDGRTYAVGLTWRTIDLAEGRPVPLANAAAKAAKADLYCLRKPGQTQFGLGSTKFGHKPGMPSLAAAIAAAVQGSWVGLFAVDGGYYLGACRDDQILAGCDRVIVDHAEAVEAFSELFGGATWDNKFAPESSGFEEGDVNVIGLSVVLADKSIDSGKLRRVGSRRLLLALLGILVVGIAGFAWIQYQAAEDERLAEEAARAAAQRSKAAVAPKKAEIVPLPWEGKPFGVPTLQACVDAIIKAPIDVPGWKTATLSCDGKSVFVGLKRDGGTINWIGAYLNHGDFKPAVTENGDEAIVSWALPAPTETYTKDSKTNSVSADRRYLESQFEEVFHKPSFDKAQDSKFYSSLPFSLATFHDPREFESILAHIPVFVLSEVKLDIAAWNWTIKGIVYEQLTPPPQGQTVKPGARGPVAPAGSAR